MSSSKPAFAIFAGAFHLSSSLDLFRKSLSNRGYDTFSATLPSVGSSTHGLQDDVDRIGSVLDTLFESGRNVILCAHSYAGIPGSVAAKGNSKRERAECGQEGGIVGLIWLTAFVPKEGLSHYEVSGSMYADWIDVKRDEKVLEALDPGNTFYHDVLEPQRSKSVADVKSHSIKSIEERCLSVGLNDPVYDGCRVYVRTIDDKAVPLFVQDMILEASKASGVDWVVKDISTSHSPFLSRPDELADLYVGLAKKFTLADGKVKS